MTRNDDLSEIKENVATLVANQSNAKDRLDRIIPYLEEGYRHRTEVISRLSVVESTISTYQKDCTTDRERLDERVGKVEKTQARNSGIAAGISFIFGTIGAFFGGKL
jgi:hypothetical protein